MEHGQLRAIFWLRWKLTSNQWRRAGPLEALLGRFLFFAALGAGLVAGLAGLLGGVLWLGPASPQIVLAVWFALTVVFLSIWMLEFLNELQRSETIDLARLLHLPISPLKVFLFNYAASHLRLSIVLVGGSMLGLALGGVIARGPAMLGLGPLVVAYLLMVTAWTYWARGWLAGRLENPRFRRRLYLAVGAAALIGLATALVLMTQASRARMSRPGPATRAEAIKRSAERRESLEQTVRQLIYAQRFVPPLWMPAAAHAAAGGRPWPAVGALAGSLALAAAGLYGGYRGTVRFYRGETGGRAAAPGAGRRVAGRRGVWLARSLPGVPQPVAAVALATVRSYSRESALRIIYASTVFMIVVGGAVMTTLPPLELSPTTRIFLPGLVGIFGMMQCSGVLMNQFGLDRQGFRAFVLSPIRRRQILVGKNLAALVLVGPVAGAVALFGWGCLRLSPAELAVAAVQLAALFPLAWAAGNIVSLLAPSRLSSGGLSKTKMPARTVVLMVLAQLLFPVLLTPALLGPLAQWGWEQSGRGPGLAVNGVVSAVVLALAALGYRWTLAPLDRLFHRLERRVMGLVTLETE